MKRDMMMLKIVQALEKGLIPPSPGWNEQKAKSLLDAMSERPKLALPEDATSNTVYEIIHDILVSLSDAEEEYVPKWAKPLLS
jgi:hypothetical protein